MPPILQLSFIYGFHQSKRDSDGKMKIDTMKCVQSTPKSFISSLLRFEAAGCRRRRRCNKMGMNKINK